MNTTKYASCNVTGDGKLYTDTNVADNFKIIDMSAEAMRLETPAALHANMRVKLKIRLKGIPVDVHLDINGIVKSQLYKGFEIEFHDLSDFDREEIDELMRSTCNIED
ncbi:MAG: hypothetical protein K0R50_1297 [Eubacterium sp.]|nr:hypothetical protein [Eubacterium sp.]